MYLGDIDLKVTPDAMPPLPLVGVNRRDLRKRLLDGLAAVGCTFKLLQTFEPGGPVVWELPPTYTPTLDGKGVSITPPQHLRRRVNELYKVYAEADRIIIDKGLTNEALKPVEEFAGPLAMHPLVFSRERETTRARALFATEFVAFFKDIGSKAVVHGNTITLKTIRHWSEPPIGLRNGKFEGVAVDPQISGIDFYAGKGTVQFQQVDLHDHLYNWVSYNFISFENPDEILRLITMLKLTQEHGDYYWFEQELRNIEPFRGQPLTVKADLYTDGAFDYIRETWLEVDRSMEDRLKDLARLLVPSYIDGVRFIAMFGVDPSAGEALNDRQKERAVSGMEKFNKLFNEIQRKIRDGKFVGLE